MSGIMVVRQAVPALPWTWEPSVVAGLLLLAVGYIMVSGPLEKRFTGQIHTQRWQRIAFFAGWLAVMAALCSPLDALADHDLFSAHMAQHMLLTYVAPPLWLLGMPAWLFEKIATSRIFRSVGAWLFHPVLAFVLFNGMMWVWHLPPAYDAALESESLHIVEHLLFMSTAVIGWWLVFGPRPGPSKGSKADQQSYILKIGYLFASSLACTALAAIITFSPNILYGFYGNQPLLFGLSPQLDQQLGGVLMWLPGDMILMTVLIWTAARWLGQSAHPGSPTEEYDAISR